jgi:hypothetical protein
MTTPSEIRQTVRTLAAQGKSRREISRLLALSRNTVRRILHTPAGEALGLEADAVPPCDEETLAKLKVGFERARGNVVRVQEEISKGTAMKTTLGAFAAFLLAGAIYIQPAQAQVQVQPAPGFSLQIGPDRPPPRDWRREERRDREEGYYGSGREDRREERWREERRARERCDRILNPIERDRCFYSLR